MIKAERNVYTCACTHRRTLLNHKCNWNASHGMFKLVSLGMEQCYFAEKHCGTCVHALVCANSNRLKYKKTVVCFSEKEKEKKSCQRGALAAISLS